MAEPTISSILLVEDDEPLAAFMARHLTAHRMPTIVVGSAEDAERELESGLRPALVLLDINLPGETGWALLRSEAYGTAGRPPVVVVSATRIPAARLRECGAVGYLPKPFAMDTLVDTARRHLLGQAAEPKKEATMDDLEGSQS